MNFGVCFSKCVDLIWNMYLVLHECILKKKNPTKTYTFILWTSQVCDVLSSILEIQFYKCEVWSQSTKLYLRLNLLSILNNETFPYHP